MAQKHVIIIHGGSCWALYEDYIKDFKRSKFEADFSPIFGWQKQMQKHLGSGFKVLLPKMPNWRNARYQEWKIWFEKAIVTSGNTPIVVGHSLGAIFLVKYFSETTRPRKVKGILLVSTPYKTKADNPDFGDFALKGPPWHLKRFRQPIYFYHSKDDSIVAPDSLIRYGAFAPNAVLRIFKRRGHFDQNAFPELVEDIKAL